MANGAQTNPSDDADPKAMVREGYDRISHAYRGDSVGRDRGYFRWLDRLIPLLQAGDPVLDLGCGCGIPASEALAESFRVTGVDFSETQIDRARRLVPAATFLRADMTAIDFPPGSFAAIVALYSVIHVPLAEQRGLLGRLFDWLRPGGYLMVTVGHTAWTGTEADWHGAPMYWSHADEGTYLAWLGEIGFAVLWREFVPEGDGGHVLVLAQRPGEAFVALPVSHDVPARAKHHDLQRLGGRVRDLRAMGHLQHFESREFCARPCQVSPP